MKRDAAAYKDWWYRHLPRGPVWPVDITSTPVWDSLLSALSQEPARLDAVIYGLIDDMIPSATMGAGLLDVWETFLDLTPLSTDTTSARALAILAKLGQFLSPNLPELQAYATTLEPSAVVTRHEYSQFLCTSLCNEGIGSAQWLATWTVTYDGPANPVFEAAMRAVSPLDSTLLFVVT